ncbi:MAG: hypothetical protein KAR24_03375 [Candidatus Pacebacteria bacterium]|nr:hypothetical protein [Candidatus Paceibacterota bacterium]
MPEEKIQILSENVVRYSCKESLSELAKYDSKKVCLSILDEIDNIGKKHHPEYTFMKNEHGKVVLNYLVSRIPNKNKVKTANKILRIIEDPSRNIKFVEELIFVLQEVATKQHAKRISRIFRIDQRMSHPRYYLILLETLEKLGNSSALKEVQRFRSFALERIPASNSEVDCVDIETKAHIFDVARRVEKVLA